MCDLFQLMHVLGNEEPIKIANEGDIVSVSVSGFTPRWTQTLVTHQKVMAECYSRVCSRLPSASARLVPLA